MLDSLITATSLRVQLLLTYLAANSIQDFWLLRVALHSSHDERKAARRVQLKLIRFGRRSVVEVGRRWLDTTGASNN